MAWNVDGSFHNSDWLKMADFYREMEEAAAKEDTPRRRTRLDKGFRHRDLMEDDDGHAR